MEADLSGFLAMTKRKTLGCVSKLDLISNFNAMN